MTTNVRTHAKASERALLEIVTPLGTPVDDSTFVSVAAALDKSKQGGADRFYLTDGDDPDAMEVAWQLDHALVGAIKLDGIYYAVSCALTRAPGAYEQFLEQMKEAIAEGYDPSRAAESNFEHVMTTKVVLAGYASAGDAVLDAKRLLAAAALEENELRGVLGWGSDAVMLVRGYIWFTIRTHSDGRVEIQYNEDPNLAYETFNEACQSLARDLDFGRLEIQPLHGLMRGFDTKVAAAFIRHEAALMLSEQAKLSLTVALSAAKKISEQPGQPALDLKTLATRLYTTKPALDRAVKRIESLLDG